MVLLLAVLAALLGAGLHTRGGFSALSFGNSREYSEDLFAMDTVMSVKACGKDAEAAVKEAVLEIRRLDGLFSTGNPFSDISVLNREKASETAPETALLGARALELYTMTDGSFDPTIYPVMRLWGFTDKNYRVPSEDELQKALAQVNGSLVTVSEKQIALGEDQELDLGGIAKGYTSARVMEIFREHGIKSAIVNLGGNVQTLGERPSGGGWTIGIRDPRGESPQDLMGAVTVSDKAVITSGGYERFFEEAGKTYIHIVDPKTGRPVENDLASVTIVSPDGTLADGLSTALYVMGLENAISFWKANSDRFDCVLIDSQNRVYVSEGIAGSYRSGGAEPVIFTK